MSRDILTTIDSLDSQQLRETLVTLDRQRSAVIVLLRAAIRRDRHRPRRKQKNARVKGGAS